MNHENNSILLQAFLEKHDEANRLALSNNRLKGLNNWLEERLDLLEELKIVNTDFENLNIIYQSSNNEGEFSKLSKCENCEVLQLRKISGKNLFKYGYGNCQFECCLGFPKLYA